MILDIAKTVLNLAGKVIKGKAGDTIRAAASEIEGAASSNQELRIALAEQERKVKEIYAADFADARQLIREESRSEDPFVRRARPAFLWLFYGLIIFNFVIFPILRLIDPGFTISYPDLPDALYALFGSSFLGYVGFRSWDKRNKLKNGHISS